MVFFNNLYIMSSNERRGTAQCAKRTVSQPERLQFNELKEKLS